MKEKDIIKKWLDHEKLTKEELEAFKKLNVSDSYFRLSENAKNFKAPSYSSSENWDALQKQMKQTPVMNSKSKSNLSLLLKIAAIFVIGIGLYFSFFNSSATTIATKISEKSTIELPDNSSVQLNSATAITYDKKKWLKERKIELDGEAYFKVERGSTFDVQTTMGTVTVVGTQFNVKQRENTFEVACYEGVVSVSYQNNDFYLRPGDYFEVLNSKGVKKTHGLENPSWTRDKSTFLSTPYHKVIKELEWQYGVKVSAKNIDLNTVFSGNFVHSNIQMALKSITIPMRLKYKIEKDHITLYPAE